MKVNFIFIFTTLATSERAIDVTNNRVRTSYHSKRRLWFRNRTTSEALRNKLQEIKDIALEDHVIPFMITISEHSILHTTRLQQYQKV